MKEIIAATWKVHRKDLPGNSFPLGSQHPTERKTIMKSNSCAQYKWFSFYLLFSVPKSPQTISATTAWGYSMRMPHRCVWTSLSSKGDSGPSPFSTPSPLRTTVSFRTSLQSMCYCILTLRRNKN